MHTHTTILQPFPGPPRWAGARRELLDLWCNGRLTEADTDQSAGRHSIRPTSAHLPPSTHFLQAGCPSCRPANSVKALKDWKSRMQKITGNSPSGHHRTTLSGYIFATKAPVDNRKKKLVKQQYLLHMSPQYGELWPTINWDCFVNLWHRS